MRANYLYAHDPACHCCHPHDRPYCPCACHTGPSRGEAVLEEARRPPAPAVDQAAQIAALDRLVAQLAAELTTLREAQRAPAVPPPDPPREPPRRAPVARMVTARRRDA